MRYEQFASGTNGRLKMGMALLGPSFTSSERNAEDFAFARNLGLPISVHVGMAGSPDAVTALRAIDRRRAQRAKNPIMARVTGRLPSLQGIASITTPCSGHSTRRGA